MSNRATDDTVRRSRRCPRPLLLSLGAIAVSGSWSTATAADVVAPGGGHIPVSCLAANDHMRISLPWPASIPYSIGRDGHSVILSLPGPVQLDPGPLRAGSDRCATSATVRHGDTETVLRFEPPANMEVRDTRIGGTLVVDLFRRPVAVVGAGAGRGAEPSWPPPISSPSTAAAEPDSAAVPSQPAEEPARAEQPPRSLRFSWSTPAAAAAFRRGNHLWVVFDQPSRQDSEILRRSASGAGIERIDQQPHPRATILRMTVAEGINPRLERNGNAWIVQLETKPATPTTTAFGAHPDSEKDGTTRLLLPVAEPAEPLAFTDPDVGDSLVVVPTRTLGAGVARGYDLPQLRLLPSAQGIVIQPLVDDLRVRAFPEGVDVSRVAGLQLSSVSDAVRAAAAISTAPVGSRVIAAIAWPAAAPANFNATFLGLTQALSRAGESDRPSKLLDLARFYVGAGLGAEALGALDRWHDAAPAAPDDPQVRLLHGIAQWLVRRGESAAADLRQPALDNTDEGRMWQALAIGGTVDPAALAVWSTIVASYPPELRRAAGLALLDVTVNAGAIPTAGELLDGLRILVPDTRVQAWFDYQDGRIKAAAGDVEGAAAIWTKVIDGENREAAARASFDRVQLLRREDKMPLQEAIDTLDRLRVTWRGDELQFQVMRELGRLQGEAGDPLAALRTWRETVSLFPKHPDSPALTRAMSDLFERAFADSAPGAPWKTVALFEEFKELVPGDVRGRALMAAYAERLAAADLRPQAAAVLESLLASAPSSEDAAATALRLAELQLADGKAEAALKSSAAADRPSLAPGLQRQRRLVVAQALLALDRPDEALATIEADSDTNADTVRLAAQRRKGDWSAAAATIERMGGEPATSTSASGQTAERRLLDRAAALTLAKDRERLAGLRDEPGFPTADSPTGKAIELMTKPQAAIPLQADAIAAAVADAETLAAAAKRSAAAAPVRTPPAEPRSSGGTPEASTPPAAHEAGH